MLTKHYLSHKLDSTAEFFKQAGMIYHKDNTEHGGNEGSENSDDSDDSDNERRTR